MTISTYILESNVFKSNALHKKVRGNTRTAKLSSSPIVDQCLTCMGKFERVACDLCRKNRQAEYMLNISNIRRV